ncbi:MAG: serine hydrolase [Bacteroidetes bacterium]|jgi:CubicO group peptidase (beta-lactamase class C family)|nr:serine hydrolase [Bacteroidota bacterium]
MRRLFALLLILPVVGVHLGWGQLPESGRPVPALADFDTEMQNFMDDNAIGAGILGVMYEGRVVYLRGFGHDYNGNDLPENALFRLASCTKPLTAAAIRSLINDGAFNLMDNAFELGQTGGGVLNLVPFPSPGDSRLEDITIQHLLVHQGGWDDDVTDLAFQYWTAAEDMNVTRPPSREDMMRWSLGQPLQFTPGTITDYANIGYHALGRIVEQEAGQSLGTYLRQNILTPNMWVPATELQLGRTFRVDQDPREPLYDSPNTGPNVFEGMEPEEVPTPYGWWHQAGLQSFGGFIASAPTMLAFLQRYHTGVWDNRIGQPITSGLPVNSERNHNGILDGLNTLMVQRPDGVNVFIAFNQRGDPQFANTFYSNRLQPLLDGGNITWPETTSDGFWIDTGGTGSGGVGGYHAAFGSFAAALAYVQDGSKLRLFGGTTGWTGTLSKRLLLDAPLGSAVLGE